MTYTFGSKTDLLLTKKIEHWAKKISNMKKLGDYVHRNKLDVALFTSIETWFYAQIQDINKINIDMKQKEKMKKDLEKATCKEYLSKYIIPDLITSGFFKTYTIPVKKHKVMTNKDNLDRRYTL